MKEVKICRRKSESLNNALKVFLMLLKSPSVLEKVKQEIFYVNIWKNRFSFFDLAVLLFFLRYLLLKEMLENLKI